MLEREEDVLRMLAEGHNKQKICTDLAKKYRVAERTIETSYYEVCNSLNDDYLQNRKDVAATVYTRKDEIYKRCMQEGKYKTALDAVVAIARMGKIYEGEIAKDKLPDVINLTQGDFTKPLKAVGEGEDESSD